MRAYVEQTPTGITFGTEHLPKCPTIVEQHEDPEYVSRAEQAVAMAERHLYRTFDMMTDAITPDWFLTLLWLAEMLRVGRKWLTRLRARYWSFDGGLDHRCYTTCTLSMELKVPGAERRQRAYDEARAMLGAVFGYRMEAAAFNLPPGGVPIVGTIVGVEKA